MEFIKLQKIICGQLRIPEKLVTPTTSLPDELGADSLDLFQIITEVAHQFSAEIPLAEQSKIKTAEDFYPYIRS